MKYFLYAIACFVASSRVFGLDFKYQIAEFSDNGNPSKLTIDFRINKTKDSPNEFPTVFLLKNGAKIISNEFAASEITKLNDDNVSLKYTIKFSSLDEVHGFDREKNWSLILKNKFENNVLIILKSTNYVLGFELGGNRDEEIRKQLK